MTLLNKKQPEETGGEILRHYFDSKISYRLYNWWCDRFGRIKWKCRIGRIFLKAVNRDSCVLCSFVKLKSWTNATLPSIIEIKCLVLKENPIILTPVCCVVKSVKSSLNDPITWSDVTNIICDRQNTSCLSKQNYRVAVRFRSIMNIWFTANVKWLLISVRLVCIVKTLFYSKYLTLFQNGAFKWRFVSQFVKLVVLEMIAICKFACMHWIKNTSAACSGWRMQWYYHDYDSNTNHVAMTMTVY